MDATDKEVERSIELDIDHAQESQYCRLCQAKIAAHKCFTEGCMEAQRDGFCSPDCREIANS